MHEQVCLDHEKCSHDDDHDLQEHPIFAEMLQAFPLRAGPATVRIPHKKEIRDHDKLQRLAKHDCSTGWSPGRDHPSTNNHGSRRYREN